VNCTDLLLCVSEYFCAESGFWSLGGLSEHSLISSEHRVVIQLGSGVGSEFKVGWRLRVERAW